MRKGLLALTGLIALSAPMFGAVVIDFGQGFLGADGVITPTAGGNATGTGIDVQTMLVTGDGAFNGTYILFGAGASAFGSDGSAVVTFNTATGLFTVVGGVCDIGTVCNGVTNVLVASTTLATGTGSSASVTSGVSTGTLVFTEPDTKGPTLLTALGLPTNTQFVLMNATFNNLSQIGTTGTYTSGSTDIANTAVPEPTSILLLGTILFGITHLVRRRLNA